MTKEEINNFIRDWGQTPDEIKDALEEIHDYEVEVNDEFISNIDTYHWCEKYGVWLTKSGERYNKEIYQHLTTI